LIKLTNVFLLILALQACGSHKAIQPNNPAQPKATIQASLSYIKAYLQLGDIQQAQSLYDDLNRPDSSVDTLLVLAELRAAQNDPTGAQQAFFDAMAFPQFLVSSTPNQLINFFCEQKKWLALEGYAKSVQQMTLTSNQKNQYLTPVALCFYNHNKPDEAGFWLAQLDSESQLSADVYLALAKIRADSQEWTIAKRFMRLFERNKTQVTADNLWSAAHIYHVLNRPNKASQLIDSIQRLFPMWEFPKSYQNQILIADKRKVAKVEESEPELKTFLVNRSTVHVMQKGETLYSLSRKYQVNVSELKTWNPNLIVDDIPLGTSIIVKL
jgi:Tfp pilus assembly protein PilF